MPENISVDDILHKLLVLDINDLKQIQTRIDYLLSSKGMEKGSKFYVDLAFHMNKTMMMQTGKSLLIINTMPPKTKRKFLKSCGVVEEYKNNAFGVLTRPEEVRFFTLSAHLVLAHLEKVEAPAVQRAVVSTIGKIPDLIENAFPGYMRSRLSRKILRMNFDKYRDTEDED